jgi:ligand-binding sensor domain-containing protein
MKLNFLILLLLLTLRISAQTGKFYNTDNQLPSSFVNQVYQDSQGYIWIATRNGLSRYDGYQFKNFTNDDLTSAYINCICEDSKHDLYFGSNTNVQRFHNGAFETIHLYDKNTKREISTYVTSIIENKQGKILISTSGYGLLQLKDNTAMALGGATAKVLFIRKMVEDSK